MWRKESLIMGREAATIILPEGVIFFPYYLTQVWIVQNSNRVFQKLFVPIIIGKEFIDQIDWTQKLCSVCQRA